MPAGHLTTPFDDAYDYLWYAERYRWTPAQVDEIPAWVDARLPLMAMEVDAAREAAHEKAMRDAERG
ncbi:hypothetical protein ACH4UM_19075 [Streptomyces sp. NPDC020801]|uniref:hypothetical protein n=1 Tax=Streptomyces sp. NPDC020801 TaxID=3365093 RepID=UPI0037A44659